MESDDKKLMVGYWGSEKGKRKAHWKAWEDIIKPKNIDGIGFRDFRLFNQALPAPQAWRLLTIHDSLCAHVLRAKYYANGRFEDAVFSGNPSSSWQGVSRVSVYILVSPCGQQHAPRVSSRKPLPFQYFYVAP